MHSKSVTKRIKTNITKSSNMSSYIKDLVAWLINVLNLNTHLLVALLAYVEKVFRISRTRGVKEAINYNKENRKKFLKLVFSDFNFGSLDFKFPKSLKPLYHAYREYGTDALRASLSVLYMTRIFRLEPKPSFSSIEKAPGFTGNPSKLRKLMVMFLKDVGLNPKHFGRVPRRLRFSSYHHSSRSGPNGPGLWSSVQDFMSLPTSLKYHISNIGGDLITENMKHMEYLIENEEVLKFFGVSEKRQYRKLALISDKEGKTREVAIADYWTQTCLKPIHDYQSSILKNIKADCTFDQSKLVKTLQAHKGHQYHSVDLTSATDRFPIDIQKEMLSIYTNRDYAESWKQIMIGYPFDYKDGKQIYYQTGNPMGFYSSFTSFALAHHFFVWLACRRSRIKFKTCPYMLLGDDIVIGNDKVAREYKQLLIEWDVPFSPDKTYTSPVGFEFAKQIRFKGINISPISLSSFYNNRNNYTLCISFLVEELKNKEWNVDSGRWIDTYLRRIQKFSSKRLEKVKPSIDLSLSILDYLQGRRMSLGDQLVGIVSKYYTSPVLSNPAFAQVFSNEVLRKMLMEEKQTRLKTSQNIFRKKGNLRIFKLLKIIGMDRTLQTNYCYRALPFTSYYNEDVITPIIVSLKADTEEISVVDKYTPKLMRSIYSVDTRPVNLSDYYARGREVLYRTSWSIAKEFYKNSLEVQSIKVFGKPYPLKLVPI
jgi:hypothetical protein